MLKIDQTNHRVNLHYDLFDIFWAWLYVHQICTIYQVPSTGSHIVLLSWKQHLLKVHLGITENWRTAFVFGTQMSQIFRQSDFTFYGRTEADICCWLRYITTTRARVRYTLLGILLHIWVICLEGLGWPDFWKKKKKWGKKVPIMIAPTCKKEENNVHCTTNEN